MGTTIRSVITCAAALPAFGALASCDTYGGSASGNNASAQTEASLPVFSSDLKGVCWGAPVSHAKAYDPAAAGHKAVYFATYKDDFVDHSLALPKAWREEPSRDDGGSLKGVDLVVCARRTAARQLKVCEGYERDGKPTQAKVRWHAATYQLTAVEARTGRKLAEKTVEATNGQCPMEMLFLEDTDSSDEYATLSDAVVTEFVSPHMTR